VLYYLDSSALVKLYIREIGSDRMLQLAARTAGHQLAVVSVAQVEVRSALRKLQRTGRISVRLADELLGAFQRHLESKFIRQVLTDAILDQACELLDRHSLTSLDAVQLAGYFAVRTTASAEPVFASADNELLAAAKAEGIPVFDPCSL